MGNILSIDPVKIDMKNSIGAAPRPLKQCFALYCLWILKRRIQKSNQAARGAGPG